LEKAGQAGKKRIEPGKNRMSMEKCGSGVRRHVMEGKRYVRLLRPRRKIPFTSLMVYSFLYSRLSRRRSYTQALIARMLGIDKNTVLPVRRQLEEMGLVELTPRHRLRAKVPPPDWFHSAKAGPALTYTKVFLPTPSCPLTCRQNAIYWLRESFHSTGKKVFVRGIATMLGINLKTVKSSLQRLRGYQPLPDYYQDTKARISSMQIAAYTDDERLISEMREVGYTKDEISILFGQVPDAPVLRGLFKEAQAQNKFSTYRTSYALLAHKVKSHLAKPKPEQPLTWEQLEQKMSVVSDPLEMLTPEYLRHDAYSGRVTGVYYKTHVTLLRDYGADRILEVLRTLPHLPNDHQAQITVDRLQEMLEQTKRDNPDTVK